MIYFGQALSMLMYALPRVFASAGATSSRALALAASVALLWGMVGIAQAH